MGAVPPEAQKVLDAAVGRYVLAEMYEEDISARLAIDVSGGRIGLTLTSGTQSMISPSNDLLDAVGMMVRAHEREGTGLAGVVYEYAKDAAGGWTMVGRFSYAD